MRLNKIAKDFNVGIQTLVEFLEKKTGFTVEEGKPLAMTNVSDEQYELLRKEFNKDKSVKEESERERQERQQTRDKIKEETRAASAQTPEKAHTPSEEELSRRPKVVGTIDLNPKKAAPQPVEEEPVAAPVVEEPVAAPKVVEQPKPAEPIKAAPAAPEVKAPVAEQPKPVVKKHEAPKPQQEPVKKPNQTAMGERSRDRINNDPLPEEARNGEVFRIGTAPAPKINVVATIDLDSLNQSTRPKKKSKEERKKEREQKNAAQQEARSRHHGAQKVDINEEIKKGNNGGGRDKKSHGDARRQDRDELRQHGNNKGKKNQKYEVSEEDIQRSVRDTLARLSNKRDKKDVKYRKDKRNAAAERAAEAEEQEAAQSKILKLTEFVTANDLATMMNVPVVKVISTCMTLGLMVSINQRLDA
ncbi:MAG: translation initiation factor IF-2 N-terminal domain-containing protein, partial [Bacteroidales bacterium]|nr:translation initiation factor IF-2 N-terminal domain-containing protein [Bacteroidales bacterium]